MIDYVIDFRFVRILQVLVFARQRGTGLMAVYFFSCFLIVGWLTLAMLAGFDPGGQSGPVFHSEAC